MYYTKECFSINEAATIAARKEYETKRDQWYKTAIKLYPNYYKMSLRERLAIRNEINEAAGYSI